MASAPNSESLSRTLIGLLAEAAFVFAEPTTTPMPADENPLVARLTLAHDETWELCVCVQDKLGDVLAANLLGTESETREARAASADAVGELANILAGALAVGHQTGPGKFGRQDQQRAGWLGFGENRHGLCARLS